MDGFTLATLPPYSDPRRGDDDPGLELVSYVPTIGKIFGQIQLNSRFSDMGNEGIADEK